MEKFHAYHSIQLHVVTDLRVGHTRIGTEPDPYKQSSVGNNLRVVPAIAVLGMTWVSFR